MKRFSLKGHVFARRSVDALVGVRECLYQQGPGIARLSIVLCVQNFVLFLYWKETEVSQRELKLLIM